ncbi:MAG TPA: tetratricopeptide repeat protein, partial [Myxococcota bacterium]|nr:tetratricopeptide repeat protein [Myxococcota bacterium]
MTLAPRSMLGVRIALLVALAGLPLAGCAWLRAAPESTTSLDEYREYMAERAAAEVESEKQAQSDATFEQKLAAAQRAHRAGDAENAMRQYFEAFRLDPADTRAHAGIAYLQLSRQPERAEEVLLKVIEANPNATMAYVGVGLAKLAQDDPDAAASYLEQAIALDPSSANAHDAYAVVLEEMQLFDDAQTHARRASELAPNNSAIVNNYGIASLLAGDPKSAERAFRNAASLEPRDSAYRNNLGIALGRQGRYTEALTAFRSAGSEQAAHNNLGYVYYMNGMLDEAIAHYERALEAEGDDRGTILRNLDAALAAKGVTSD